MLNVANFIIKMQNGKKEMFYNGTYFVKSIDYASEYARSENAEREIRVLHKHGALDKYLEEGYEFYAVQVTRVELQGVKLNIAAKPKDGFIIVNGNEFYKGPKNSKRYGFYNFTPEYDGRTIFKTEKEAKKCLESFTEYYKTTAESMEESMKRMNRVNTYWVHYHDALNCEIKGNY